MNEASEEKVKIGGWLIVLGVFLWVEVLTASFNTLVGLMTIATHHPTNPRLLVNGVPNVVLLVPMLVMFHRRKAAIVWWSIIYGIYVVIDEWYIQYRLIITHSSTTLAGHVIAIILEALLMTGVVMYFFKSRRVKRTFVR